MIVIESRQFWFEPVLGNFGPEAFAAIGSLCTVMIGAGFGIFYGLKLRAKVNSRKTKSGRKKRKRNDPQDD